MRQIITWQQVTTHRAQIEVEIRDLAKWAIEALPGATFVNGTTRPPLLDELVHLVERNRRLRGRLLQLYAATHAPDELLSTDPAQHIDVEHPNSVDIDHQLP